MSGVAVLATLPTLGAALRAAMREVLTMAARADVDPWRAASTVAGRAVVPWNPLREEDADGEVCRTGGACRKHDVPS